jgi:hypothetical protein
MDIEQLKRKIRQYDPEERSSRFSQLVLEGRNQGNGDVALFACVELLKDGAIDKDGIEPQTNAILALWAECFSEVLRLQKNPAHLDWIVEEDYLAVRRRGCILLDLMGYLPMESVESSFNDGLTLNDPRLKMHAALSLLRNLRQVSDADLYVIAASHRKPGDRRDVPGAGGQ